jgi:hypothetical protein
MLNGASSVSGDEHPRRNGDDLARRKAANHILLNADDIFAWRAFDVRRIPPAHNSVALGLATKWLRRPDNFAWL